MQIKCSCWLCQTLTSSSRWDGLPAECEILGMEFSNSKSTAVLLTWKVRITCSGSGTTGCPKRRSSCVSGFCLWVRLREAMVHPRHAVPTVSKYTTRLSLSHLLLNLTHRWGPELVSPRMISCFGVYIEQCSKSESHLNIEAFWGFTSFKALEMSCFIFQRTPMRGNTVPSIPARFTGIGPL